MSLASQIADSFAAAPPIRVVNYHNTPAYRADDYDRELAALAERYAPVTEDDLAAFFASGHWAGGRPGVIVALYNGYRNNHDVMRPLLERHGLVGWFFAVTGWTSCPPDDQRAFAARRTLALVPGEYADGRHALSWDELKSLDQGHVVASHTRNHARIAADDADGQQAEIVGAQDDFREHLGHPVRSFAWLLSGTWGHSAPTDACLERAGYEFLFSDFKLQRLPHARSSANEKII
ncbi:polysaccharide deacetylase family protein [Sphingomonas jatrophae]|uniref:Chitooligosaccharide deacetylase n=1 Tax=Sphingomonas jatrophae TaxID=1166337 RepID=A0A1I6M9T4_9SPHN|nr:polysaccharide deacetylase family protein [Sphingomonas jatrophae]SFS12486.1 Polysaccharide deacetylase [Sphingomonas jatrophae]